LIGCGGGREQGFGAMLRRNVLLGGGAVMALLAGSVWARGGRAGAAAPARTFEVTYSDAEWRQRLTPAQYSVLRQEGTEPAGSSPLDAEERPGTYACAGCALPLYSSATKYHSGTGWPSFWQPLDDAVLTIEDKSFFMTRTAVECRRCGGHLGHVFDDGPEPTGLRYCMNGVAMVFQPAAGVAS
jgi:peptide-methionine (R)-S-oxide reductase